MKSLVLIFSLLFSGSPEFFTSGNEFKNITKAVEEFSNAADQRDLDRIDKIMHKDYRSVVNQLFGSKEVSIMDKTLYLDLLKQGKIGGDKREVIINSINVIGKNAVVQVTLSGKELLFETFMQLVQTESGDWLVISDMPDIKKK